MKEEVLSFDKLTEEQKEIGLENYKDIRLSNADEDLLKEYKTYTDKDWYECASGYSYLVQSFDDGSCCVYCLF